MKCQNFDAVRINLKSPLPCPAGGSAWTTLKPEVGDKSRLNVGECQIITDFCFKHNQFKHNHLVDFICASVSRWTNEQLTEHPAISIWPTHDTVQTIARQGDLTLWRKSWRNWQLNLNRLTCLFLCNNPQRRRLFVCFHVSARNSGAAAVVLHVFCSFCQCVTDMRCCLRDTTLVWQWQRHVLLSGLIVSVARRTRLLAAIEAVENRINVNPILPMLLGQPNVGLNSVQSSLPRENNVVRQAYPCFIHRYDDGFIIICE